MTDMLSFINNCKKIVLWLKNVTDIFHYYSCH